MYIRNDEHVDMMMSPLPPPPNPAKFSLVNNRYGVPIKNKKKADEKAARRKLLGDLAVEVIRLCLRNDYAWAREGRGGWKGEKERLLRPRAYA